MDYQSIYSGQEIDERLRLAGSAYQKPREGIPSTDLSEDVNELLEKADSAYQKPEEGIPSTDLSEGVQESLEKADDAYQKPQGGIPKSDMTSGVQASLDKADSSYQKPQSGIPDTDLASGVQTSLNKADSAYQKPQSGIPKTDLASGVQTSLNKADSAYQKPANGIAKTDLASGVQASLEKAEYALPAQELAPIEEEIAEQASSSNKLADKNFVNSSIATNTANYISDNGEPFTSVADLEAYSGPLTNNDYAFVVGTDAAGNTTYTRYKYNATTGQWAEEYVLNNSSFTADQWAAISSGITALLVQKLSSLPTEVVTYVSQTLTDAQKSQARTNIGATAPEIFWAEYGTTTAEEITQAVSAGKVVMTIYSGKVAVYYTTSSTFHTFTAINREIQTLRIDVQLSNSNWSVGYITLEQTSRKVSTIEGSETDTNKYPNCKAVADYVGGMIPTDMVKYSPQTLTESQQMQARKNQGLYNESNENNVINCASDSTIVSAINGGSGSADCVVTASSWVWGSRYLYRESSVNTNGADIASVYSTEFDISEIVVDDQHTNYDIVTCGTSNNPSLVTLYVVKEDNTTVNTSDGDFSLNVGIWLSGQYEGGTVSPHIDSITYTVKSLTKVESKYLPIATSLTSQSTDEEAPSAKAVYDELATRYTKAELEAMAETWTFTMANGTTQTRKIIVLP